MVPPSPGLQRGVRGGREGGTQDKHKGDPRGESDSQGNTFLYWISGGWIPNLSFYFYSPYEEEGRSHNNDPPGRWNSRWVWMCGVLFFFLLLLRDWPGHICPKPAAVVLWVIRITLFQSSLPVFVIFCPPPPSFSGRLLSGSPGPTSARWSDSC